MTKSLVTQPNIKSKRFHNLQTIKMGSDIFSIDRTLELRIKFEITEDILIGIKYDIEISVIQERLSKV